MKKNIQIKKLYQFSSVLLAGVLLSGNIMSATAYAAEDSSNGKEEVVYVNTDANGNITGTYVVNIFTNKEITDYGNYSEVRNMNTQDTINYENGVVTIQNSGQKLYYEGTLENVEIPWNISISYKIDGVEYTPEEVVGKSGKLEINMSVTKNENATEGFFDNYALQAVVQLDNTICENIIGDGATIANVGNLKQLTYTVLPGNDKEITISADVTDFEMESIAINGVRLNLDVDKDSFDTSELTDSIDDLQEAVKELNDGAGDLNSGASDLKDGASQLNEGIVTIDDALATLNSKSEDLTSGSQEVKSALHTIQSSLEEVNLSTNELEELGVASNKIESGIDSLVGGLQNVDGSITTYYNSLEAAGLTDVDSFVDSHSQAVTALGITNTQRELYAAYLSGGESDVIAKLAELVASADEEATALYSQYAGGDETAVTQYVSIAGKLISVESLLEADIAYIQGSEMLIQGIDSTLDGNSGELMLGALSLQSNYNTFNKGIQNMVSSLSTLIDNLNDLKDGIDVLTENYDTLDDGVNEYTDAVEAIYEGYAQLTDGAVKMVNATTSLYEGTNTLTEGTEEFVDETDGMQDEIDTKIDDMIEEFQGTDYDTVSFVSDKNTDVKSVQFVIKAEALKKAEVENVEDTSNDNLNLWQKFLNLFGF